MTRTLRFVIAVVAALGLSGQAAFAAGGWRSGPDAPERSPEFEQGANLVVKERFAEAIPLLDKAATFNDKDPDVHNLLGYSHRKLGDVDKALMYYQRALELDGNHLGANEYLGQLYLEMGQLEKAEERLSTLNWACLFGCEEYTELKEAIAAYKAKTGK